MLVDSTAAPPGAPLVDGVPRGAGRARVETSSVRRADVALRHHQIAAVGVAVDVACYGLRRLAHARVMAGGAPVMVVVTEGSGGARRSRGGRAAS